VGRVFTAVTLRQAFHFKVLGNSEKRIELLLSHVDLPVIHEI